MNPNHLPALTRCLRSLGAYADKGDITDATLSEIATELRRARSLLASARGDERQVNRCRIHRHAAYDPAAPKGCLLCGRRQQQPPLAWPELDDFDPGDVLRHLVHHGQEAASERYGPRAVARAIAIAARQSATQPPGEHNQPEQPAPEQPAADRLF